MSVSRTALFIRSSEDATFSPAHGVFDQFVHEVRIPRPHADDWRSGGDTALALPSLGEIMDDLFNQTEALGLRERTKRRQQLVRAHVEGPLDEYTVVLRSPRD